MVGMDTKGEAPTWMTVKNTENSTKKESTLAFNIRFLSHKSVQESFDLVLAIIISRDNFYKYSFTNLNLCKPTSGEPN